MAGLHKVDQLANSAGTGPNDFLYGAYSASGLWPAYQTIVSAAQTSVLTVQSPQITFITGSTAAQIVQLPVTSTLVQLGQQFFIYNYSTISVQVNSSGGSIVATIPPNSWGAFSCILLSGTTAASWSASVIGSSAFTGVKNINNAAYAITTTDGYQTIVSNTTITSTRVVTLPAAASSAGRSINFKRNDTGGNTNLMQIVCAGADTFIDTSTTQNLYAQYSWMTVTCDGTYWYITSVGDYIESQATTVNAGSTSSPTTIVSISIGPGKWNVSLLTTCVAISGTTVVNTTTAQIGIGTTTNSFTGQAAGYDNLYVTNLAATGVGAPVTGCGVIPNKSVALTSATTYFGVCAISYTGSIPTWNAVLRATRYA